MSQREPPRLVLRLLEVLVVAGALFHRHPARPLAEGVDAEDLAAGYEHTDMNPAVVATGAAGLIVMLGLVLLVVTLLGQMMAGVPFSVSRPADLISGLQGASAPTVPAPALEAESGQTVDPYRAAEQQKLNSYGWVDRSGGVIRMPIDRAMDLTAERGLPSRPAPPDSAHDTGGSSASVASSGRTEESYP